MQDHAECNMEDIFLLFRLHWAPTSPEELTLELAEGFMEPGVRETTLKPTRDF